MEQLLYSVHWSPKKIEDAKMLDKHSEMKNRKKSKNPKRYAKKKTDLFGSLRLLHVL